MSRDLPRWVLVVVLLACVVALVVWARGTEHHRGIFVGALGADHALAQGPTG
jgi:hypothetical protein